MYGEGMNDDSGDCWCIYPIYIYGMKSIGLYLGTVSECMYKSRLESIRPVR